ncbi:MAG: bifunctional oligoribonuclease/PAP phosphatase NrnA [Clostridiales bacterium]|nr:bifunctional oligoribonuclease/PAP phosphatase NrnA [Candidatus Apopatousia equi]
MIFDEIKSEIDNAQNIAIFTHRNSDCDALGSSISLKLYLESLNKNVQIFVQKPICESYFFLDLKKHCFSKSNMTFDLAISLDSPSKKRLGIFEKKFDSIKRSIAIDHHESFDYFADVNYVDSTASSTCLILHQFFKYVNFEIDQNIALHLYSGMATDTGCFVHGNMDGRLFNAVGDLFNTGFDFEKANYYLFERRTLGQAMLYQKAISKVEIFDNEIAIICIEKSVFDETNTTPDDTFGVVDFIRNIEGIKLSCLLSEYEQDKFMVSIRSRNNIARKTAEVFGGGGHLNASGCRIYADKENAVKQMLDACKKVLKEEK